MSKKSKKRYKNDLPVLESDQDFYKVFEGKETLEEKNKIFRDIEHDKNGIQTLENDLDINQEFLLEDEIEDNFSELLEESLKGKSQSSILREKKDKKASDPVPIKKRIERYPPPESDLDLHGYNATGARVLAKSFITSQHQQGIFTVRIIVGKGTNSEFGPVLPDVIEDLLAELKKEDVVLWFEWEKKKKSKSGSVIIYLKQFTF